VEGNRYGISIAAEIIAAKYDYHLPFYRQHNGFAGGGWCPTRSTLLNILTAAECALRPLEMATWCGDMVPSVLGDMATWCHPS
jgi:transposase